MENQRAKIVVAPWAGFEPVTNQLTDHGNSFVRLFVCQNQ